MQRLIYFTTIFIILSLIASSQTNAQGWRSSATQDTGLCEFETAVTQTTDGGYMAVGAYLDTLQVLKQLRVHKFDVDGTELWHKDFADTTNVQVTDIIACSDGNYLICGTKTNYNTTGFALKIDDFGNMIWEYEAAKINSGVGLNRVTESASGGYLLTGAHGNNINFLIKVNSLGTKEWESTNSLSGAGNDVVENPDQSIIVVAGEKVIKYDAVGNVIWNTIPVQGEAVFTVERTTDGYIIGSSKINPNSVESSISKMDFNGVLLWTTPTSTTFYSIQDLKLTNDGIIYLGRHHAWSSQQPIVVKLDTLGNEIWRNYIPKSKFLNRLLINANDEIVCSSLGIVDDQIRFFYGSNFSVKFVINCNNPCFGYCLNFCGSDFQVQAITYDTIPTGVPPFSYAWSNAGTTAGNSSLCQDSTYFLSIYDNQGTPFIATLHVPKIRSSRVELIKLSENGLLYSNIIKGNVYRDTNTNCAYDTSEIGFNQLLVQVDGDDQFVTFTNQFGDYAIDVDSGSYTITPKLPNPLFEHCLPVPSFTVDQNDSVSINLPVKSIADCPYMTIWKGMGQIRKCATNFNRIRYCNEGTIDATNAYLEVTIDTALTITTSSIPWTSQTGNTYTFQLGTVPYNACGDLYFQTLASCYITTGQTITNTVHAYPDTMCFPPFTTWDSTLTELKVNCLPDSVSFDIKNIGSGTMNGPLNFVVAEDNIILKTGGFQLAPNETKSVKFPANGSTYRMYAQQSEGYFPVGYQPTIAVEGCGTNSSGSFSKGFVNDFPITDNLHYKKKFHTEVEDPYANKIAQERVGKQASPEGVGVEHIIEQNVDLEYVIRFQNTGADTNLHVVIRDTLSEHLDITTLQPGVGSHDYKIAVVGKNILKFTFPNIQLVDSTTSEFASHGFVSFRISQKDSLPLGTMIYNSASVYFDYQLPKITNETWHEIGEFFIDISTPTEEAAELTTSSVKVFPNPFNEYADIVFTSSSEHAKTLSVCDAMGRIVLTVPFENNRYRLYRNQLPTGLYFFTVLDERRAIAHTGKFVIK